VVINLAQELSRRIESYLDKVDLSSTLDLVKRVLSKHVDVLLTYTLEEYEDSDLIISMVRSSTSLFQRTLLITDTFTLCRLINYLRRLVIRGGLSILVLDYEDCRDQVPEDQLIIESGGIEIVRDIKKSIDISETLEEPVLVRVPLYSLKEIEDNDTAQYYRSSGLFYRDWKIKYAWITGHLILREDSSNIREKVMEVIVNGSSPMRIVIDYQLHDLVRDIVPDYTILSPKIYTLTSLKKIVNKESDIVISTSKKVTELSVKRERIDIAYKCLEKYMNYIWEKCSKYLRPLLTLLYTLLNIYRDKNIIVCSSYLVPVIPSKGKYDMRLVTRVPVNIFDTVDIVLENCVKSLKLFEDKLPKNFLIICITDYKMLITNLNNIPELKSTKFIILVDNLEDMLNIVNMLKMFNIKFMILDINNHIVDSVRKLLETDVKVIIIFRDSSKNLRIVRELCDRCGNCVKIYCKSISISGDGVSIDFQSCTRCQACVIACTREAIQLSEESHNQLQTQHEEDLVQQG